jgi:hypothetical protein
MVLVVMVSSCRMMRYEMMCFLKQEEMMSFIITRRKSPILSSNSIHFKLSKYLLQPSVAGYLHPKASSQIQVDSSRFANDFFNSVNMNVIDAKNSS